MNASDSPAPVRRRWSLLRWIGLCFLVALVPVVILVVAALSFVTLDRDAATLRQEVVAASNAKWKTKVQVSAGWATLAAARTVLRFVDHEHRNEARDALAAVRRASVGVYERAGRAGDASPERLFAHVDRAMGERRWTRLVGVDDERSIVLVYTTEAKVDDEDIGVCVAVVNDDQLVVLSTSLRQKALLKLIERHVPRDTLHAQLAAIRS